MMDKLLVEMQQSRPDEHERGEMDVVGRQHDVIGMINTTNDFLVKSITLFIFLLKLMISYWNLLKSCSEVV